MLAGISGGRGLIESTALFRPHRMELRGLGLLAWEGHSCKPTDRDLPKPHKGFRASMGFSYLSYLWTGLVCKRNEVTSCDRRIMINAAF